MICLLSTSDTDLLTATVANEEPDVDFTVANPTRLSSERLNELCERADIIVVRLLGGKRAWETGLATVLASGKPVVCVSGELAVDAELTEISTVNPNVVTQAHTYLAEGAPQNLANLYYFLSDTVLLTGFGFETPVHLPMWGYLSGYETPADGRPHIGIVYYRAQELAGNTAYVQALAETITANGGVPVPVYSASLRQPDPELLEVLSTCDTIITTVLAAGGTKPAGVGAGGDDEAWNVEQLAQMNIPIIQGLALTTPRDQWQESSDGLSPVDVASQVAVPEFDGRIIAVPFSFKEYGADGLISYHADPERCTRLARIAINTAMLRLKENKDKKAAVMLSAYPTKHARIGNAVGLDTPASTLRVLHAMEEAGYDLGDTSNIPGYADLDGDALMHAIIEAGGHDPEWLTPEVMEKNELRVSAETYKRYFDTLPESMREKMEEAWGEAPGELYVHPETKDIYVAGLRFGNVVVMVQPPRGFGDNPVGIYHDPDLPATHHYLATYLWLREDFGADAIVHMGKHGNLEWLPGKTLGMSAECFPDQAIADLPMIYPFLVNDPGEGTQAKRRAHATLIDHMIPPMARAETYGDITRLEQLLDEHQNLSALDPSKLPAIRQEIWTLLTAAKMDKDLGWEKRPDEEVFDDMLMHVDGWLCEIKDVAIRGGLHILGEAPTGRTRIELLAAMLRSRQLWGGTQTLPGIRQALGLDIEDDGEERVETDRTQLIVEKLLIELDERDFAPEAVTDILAGAELPEGSDPVALTALLTFTCKEIVPRLNETAGEIDQIIRALDSEFVPAGPSGSPMRGLVNVLPTGRNFYSVDPKAIPSRLAWETGQLLADSLIERYQKDHDGAYPQSVGLSVWGTSAMRTSGDDIAEVFALLGVLPVWDEGSRRVTSLEVIPLEELGRPRIDVTVRISGFFRDAFPHVLSLIDDAVQLVAGLDEKDSDNYVKANSRDVTDGHVKRIFGSKPGTYGAGLLQLMDSGQWHGDEDLAAVYTEWGGYAYGRGINGEKAVADMKAAYKRISVAAKNIDTAEHDIADSDDYFQFHGGMVATVRHLTGEDPDAFIGDSTRTENVKTRTLHEESRRVFRARVVNPRWIDAMKNHGYKGAFEMSATVDYLFGYDATTGLMDDWMYEQLTDSYVRDNRDFFEESNPWALRDISERLLEAADRGLWENPRPEDIDTLKQTFLDMEAEAEGEDEEDD